MRVLFLTHRVPYPPNRGDRIRAYHILQTLRHHARIELVSLSHDEEESSSAGRLGDLVDAIQIAPVRRVRNLATGALALATTKPLTHALLDSPAIRPILRRIVTEGRPDVILAYGSGMARFAMEPPLTGLPLVVDMVDVDSYKWQALAASTAPPLNWLYAREAKWLSRFEARIARRAFATTVVNDRERSSLAQIAPDARVEIVPIGVDYEYFRPPSVPTGAPHVVFCGVMNYAPNVAAAIWLARDVWPRVRQKNRDARLALVGSSPTTSVKQLASRESGIEVTGAVPDVRPYLWNAAVATAPLQLARGVQTKVLEAVAAGLPAVVTSVVAEGLPPQIVQACRVANTPDTFADAIVHELAMPAHTRRAIAERVDFSMLSWSRQLDPLIALLESAAAEKRPAKTCSPQSPMR